MRNVVINVTGLLVILSALGVLLGMILGFLSIVISLFFDLKFLPARDCIEAAIGAAFLGSPFLIVNQKLRRIEAYEAAMHRARAVRLQRAAAVPADEHSSNLVDEPSTRVPGSPLAVINPANGLPMIGMVDAEGNAYGTTSSFDDLSSFRDDPWDGGHDSFSSFDDLSGFRDDPWDSGHDSSSSSRSSFDD